MRPAEPRTDRGHSLARATEATGFPSSQMLLKISPPIGPQRRHAHPWAFATFLERPERARIRGQTFDRISYGLSNSVWSLVVILLFNV